MSLQFLDHDNPDIRLALCEVPIQQLQEIHEEIGGNEFIDKHRRITLGGMLDIHHTLFTIPADIEQAPRAGSTAHATLAVANQEFVIRLHAEVSANQARFLVGHEIGHIALILDHLAISQVELSRYFSSLRTNQELNQLYEAYCDYFALRLLGFNHAPETIDWGTLPDLRSN